MFIVTLKTSKWTNFDMHIYSSLKIGCNVLNIP
jgi:hypothetical protein